MWLMDPYLDLIVWYTPEGGIYGFQLCYDKEGEERSLTWLNTGSFTHTRIDSGEGGALQAKCTPIPVAGGVYDYERVRREFLARSVLIDPNIRQFVLLKLAEANLAKLPPNARNGIYLQQNSRETGPLSEEEFLEHVRYAGLSPNQLLRIDGETEWRRISEFFPNQFPSTPRLKRSI
jgi:hypothetical protein